MVRSRLFPLALATALTAAVTVSLSGQTPGETMPSLPPHSRLVPMQKSVTPFSAVRPDRKIRSLVEFVPAGSMSERDRLLAADAESSIAERAGFQGLELEQGNWTYQQIRCSALPGHLFLQYKRNNGAGDVTVFSAAIPRSNDGRVRIIPIIKRGYSLFSPAPINALTISAFNHIRTEEPAKDRSSDWLGTGLCYAALAGAHPQIVSPDAEPTIGKPLPAMTAVMDVQERGGEVITFADAAATPRPMEWTLTFTSKGKLVKATHRPAPMVKVRPVPANSEVPKS
jgi:hypothetical protein